MNVSRGRVLAARIVAVVADAVQLGLIPLFVEGAASPVNDVLDVVVGIVMVALVGWHWAFLPAFLAELLPFADLAPTWTLAVMIATRKGAAPAGAGPAAATAEVEKPQPRALPGA